MNVLEFFRNLLLKRRSVAESWKSQSRRVVGWNCTYIPEEVIYAANVLPVRVFGDLRSTTLADAYCPRNMCSLARSCLNLALKGDYDYLDGFVTSNSCDNFGKMYDFWRYLVEIPFLHLVNTPHTNTEWAHAFFYEEVVSFKESLENAFGNPVSDESLKNAIKVYNENRDLLKKVYDLRIKDPPLISGVEALEIVLSSMVTRKEDHNKLLKQLLSQVRSWDDPPTGGVRLLVSGSVMDKTELLKLVETAGGIVVADDLCTGTRYFWDLVGSDVDPLRAISKRYLNKIPCPFTFQNEDRFRHVMEMVKRYSVKAAIVFVLKFCDTHMFDAPLLVEELKASGLPVLYLEWEHSMSGIAQLRTRVEAFMEMVKGTK